MSENPCISNVPWAYCCLDGGLGADRLGGERGDYYWGGVLVHGAMEKDTTQPRLLFNNLWFQLWSGSPRQNDWGFPRDSFSAKLRPMESPAPSVRRVLSCTSSYYSLHWVAGRAGSSPSLVLGDVILHLRASRVRLAPFISSLQPGLMECGSEKL